MKVSIPSSADLARPMPETAGARMDAAAAALAALRDERRRLERLGFERPLAHCEAQLRYWGFVANVLSLLPARGDESWRVAVR